MGPGFSSSRICLQQYCEQVNREGTIRGGDVGQFTRAPHPDETSLLTGYCSPGHLSRAPLPSTSLGHLNSPG
jgi:hypothetical protein